MRRSETDKHGRHGELAGSSRQMFCQPDHQGHRRQHRNQATDHNQIGVTGKREGIRTGQKHHFQHKRVDMKAIQVVDQRINQQQRQQQGDHAGTKQPEQVTRQVHKQQ